LRFRANYRKRIQKAIVVFAALVRHGDASVLYGCICE
jgi:hypothetical protein